MEGRGIFVCNEWKNDPENFVNWAIENGWNKELEIDRINNDGNYEPGNCRFVTIQVNSLNKRTIQSNNSSGYRGVFLNKDKVWGFQIRYKNKYLIRKYKYNNSREAALDRDRYIIKNKLPHNLNFPELLYNSPI